MDRELEVSLFSSAECVGASPRLDSWTEVVPAGKPGKLRFVFMRLLNRSEAFQSSTGRSSRF